MTTAKAPRPRTCCSSGSGCESRANIPAAGLPYGEQRRLEIARALGTQPKLLLLDEPAAGTNPTEKRELSALIRSIAAEQHQRAADRARHAAGHGSG